MVVSGVQAAGAKGVSAVQGAVVDSKDGARTATVGSDDRRTADAPARPGEPQPVVFPRKGLPVDQRPVELRRLQAAARYRSCGESTNHDDAA
jgi:hypothetical protein